MPPIERLLRYNISFYYLEDPLRCKRLVNCGRRTDGYKATGSHSLVNPFVAGAVIEDAAGVKENHSSLRLA